MSGLPLTRRRCPVSLDVDVLADFEFSLDTKIGEGTSAEVWSVRISHKKIEDVSPPVLCARVFKPHVPQNNIDEEVKKLKTIDSLQIHHCVPRFYSLYEVVDQNTAYRVILQSRLGSDVSTSMKDITESTQWESWVEAICRVYAMMMKSLNCFHKKGWLHMDIKPSNFCVPYGETIENCKRLYLIDFEKGINVDDVHCFGEF